MLNRLKSLLSSGPAREPEKERERVQVATAALLLEMAHTDEEFHDMEGLLIRDLLQSKFELPAESAAELMQYAQQARESTLDLFGFAQEINGSFTREEKFEVMEGIWRVIYADGVLDKYEDYLVRKMATLLRLSHREMIDIKVKVLDEIRPHR
ncbi:MAG: TerB family tellurite resistance protein [Desulfuromonadales bacterium]